MTEDRRKTAAVVALLDRIGASSRAAEREAARLRRAEQVEMTIDAMKYQLVSDIKSGRMDGITVRVGLKYDPPFGTPPAYETQEQMPDIQI